MHWAARFELEIQAVHVKGLDNRIPDWLSRWGLGQQFVDKFQKWNEIHKLEQTQVLDSWFDCTSQW
jgi:hypothetical protein